MSFSKVIRNQTMNKIIPRFPDQTATNVPAQSHNTSRTSRPNPGLDESSQTNSKSHNTSGLEIRHFLNILNITDEDPKNLTPKSHTKSPIRNNTSFVQQNTGSLTKRSPPLKNHSLDKSTMHNKSSTNRSFISHATASLNTINEDISLLGPLTDPPSPTFFNPTQSIQIIKDSNERNKSPITKSPKQYSYCKSARNSIVTGMSEIAPKLKPPPAKQTSAKLLDSSIKSKEIKQNTIKSNMAAPTSPFQKKNSANSSMCSMQSQLGVENIKHTDKSKSVKYVKAKSPVEKTSKRSSCDITYQDEFNMKPLLKDMLDFPEKVKISQNTTRKDSRGNENSTNTSFSKVSSHHHNLYSDILNKKLGGVSQNITMFEPSPTKGGSKPKRNIHASITEISDCTILDMLLNNTMTTSQPEKNKTNGQGAHKKGNSVQLNSQKNISKEVTLDVMKRIPKGILVDKNLSIERKQTNRKLKKSSCQQEQLKTESITRAKTNHRLRLDTAKSSTQTTEKNSQFERKESGFSIDRSDDSCSILQSPIPEITDEEKKSKSLTSLRRGSKLSETKAQEETEESSTNTPATVRGRQNVGCFERSASMRRATKEEQMDGDCVKVRRENKEFIELLNKMSKNNHIEEIQSMFGKDEQSLVKELVEYVRTQKVSIGRNRSGSYQKKITQLEKKIEEVRAKIPSLQNLNIFEENKESSPQENKTISIQRNISSPANNNMTGTNKKQTKRSSFSLEATRRNLSNTDSVSVTDMQGPPAEVLQNTLSNNNGMQSQEYMSFTPTLGALASQPIPAKQKAEENQTNNDIKEKSSSPARDIVNQKIEEIKEKTSHPSKSDTPNLEKEESMRIVADLPVIGSSIVYTQESTSPSLLTLATDTPPGKDGGPLPVLNAAVSLELKQESQLIAANKEPNHGSSSLLSSVLSGVSNNRSIPTPTILAMPVTEPKERTSPSRIYTFNDTDNHMLKPTLQRNEFVNGSFGCLPHPVEPTNNTQETAPKFGGLASLVFKAPQPSNSEQSAAHSNISTIVMLKKKLKPVYIEKLNPENLKETIYGGILEKEHPGVSFGDIHDLFENAPLNKPAPATQQQPKKEIKSIILDAKRAQNISIMAMKFRKLSMKELREAIINLDPAIMTSDTCSTLLPFCPLPDEIKACQNCKDPLDKLDTASQFLLHIYDIPQLGPRLRSTIFKNEFKERLGTVLDSISKIQHACDILKDNVHFRVFLRLSLEVANTLNEGTARGSALGLKPASLLSFDTVRSNKPGLTLLVYMAQKIHEQKPEILDFTNDFMRIADATKVNITDPIRGLQELKKEINQLKLQLDISMEKSPPDTGFINSFKEFYDTAVPLITEAEERTTKTNEHYIETAKFLGEDDESLKKKTSTEFFKVFKHLADTVDKFKTEEGEKRKREARRAAMKKINN